MTEKYDIESLIKTFGNHAIANEARRQETLKKFPDAEWAKQEFDLSAALKEICIQLQNITHDIAGLQGQADAIDDEVRG